MPIVAAAGKLTDWSWDTLILGIYENTGICPGIISRFNDSLAGYIKDFTNTLPEGGKFGEVNGFPILAMIGAPRLLLVGLGKKNEYDLNKLRRAIGKAVRNVQKFRGRRALILVDSFTINNSLATVQAISEGVILGSYCFDVYKSEPNNNKIEQVILFTEPNNLSQVERQIEKGQITAESVNIARDLVNRPAKYLTPTQMAAEATKLAGSAGMEITVLGRREMSTLGMNALLAVAQGSTEEPQLIVCKYTGRPEDNDYTAYIGKGITFDSGGISLKPSQKMSEMKGDMAGGAAVMGAMRAIGQLRPPVNILGLIPCAENMPSGNAYRPGDIITSMSGKTIEIITTDAEGRLLLADAITYAKKLGAARIVDIATLTGACVVALGTKVSGAIANNDEFYQLVEQAAQQSGERLWRLPNYEDYREQIKSDIADWKNSGGREAGAITAGLFLTTFAEDTPLTHIDIAGTSDREKDTGFEVKGATGVGVRTLIQLALNLANANR